MKMIAEDETGGVASRRRPPALRSGQGLKVQKTVTINRPVAEVYAFWNDLQNLPKFMRHLQSVRLNNGTTSHWVIQPSESSTLEWDAEIIENRANEVIAWQSLPGADVDNAGSVWFRPAIGSRGTVVKVALKYNPPGGKFAARIAKFFDEDAQAVIEEDLYRFKSLLETGEIPTTEGQPRGNR
jgi:uncharacterized membrane protein